MDFDRFQHSEQSQQSQQSQSRQPQLQSSQSHQSQSQYASQSGSYPRRFDNDIENYNETRGGLQDLSELQCYISHNYMNLATFFAFCCVFFILGVMGLGRYTVGNYKDINDQHQTLITAVFWSHFIWVAVLGFETLFILLQMHEYYRQLPIIQDGIRSWFAFANIASIGWIVSYTHNTIWLSTFFLACNALFLIGLCTSVYYSKWDPNVDPIVEYVGFRFPFHLHLGWALSMFVMSFNEMVVAFDWDGFQDTLAFCSVAYLLVVGLFTLFYPAHPNVVVPLTIAWATMGIWYELGNPRQVILNAFDQSTILKVEGGVAAVCVESIVVSILRFAHYFIRNFYIVPRSEKNQVANNNAMLQDNS